MSFYAKERTPAPSRLHVKLPQQLCQLHKQLLKYSTAILDTIMTRDRKTFRIFENKLCSKTYCMCGLVFAQISLRLHWVKSYGQGHPIMPGYYA